MLRVGRDYLNWPRGLPILAASWRGSDESLGVRRLGCFSRIASDGVDDLSEASTPARSKWRPNTVIIGTRPGSLSRRYPARALTARAAERTIRARRFAGAGARQTSRVLAGSRGSATAAGAVDRSAGCASLKRQLRLGLRPGNRVCKGGQASRPAGPLGRWEAPVPSRRALPSVAAARARASPRARASGSHRQWDSGRRVRRLLPLVYRRSDSSRLRLRASRHASRRRRRPARAPSRAPARPVRPSRERRGGAAESRRFGDPRGTGTGAVRRTARPTAREPRRGPFLLIRVDRRQPDGAHWPTGHRQAYEAA
jgi:hypothetical protein